MADSLTVRCSDGITRTGTVVYIHPLRIFAVLQFEFSRESFLLHQPDRECQSLNRYPPADFGRSYTPKDDAEILNSADPAETARKLGRTESGIRARQATLRKKPKHLSHRRRFTAEEDRIVMESKNLYQTAKKLKRTEGTICQRRQTLRRRMQIDQIRP